MIIPVELVKAEFIKRLNRFAALVLLDGKEELVHVANSGRLRELFLPGRSVLLYPRHGVHRKTSYDLAMVNLDGLLVSADARLPNVLVYEALLSSSLPQFIDYSTVDREATFGESRLDLALQNEGQRCLIEVKSITLVVEGRGLFPDAPTIRGRKHLRSLILAREKGYKAAVIFVIQREDAYSFSPHDEADPDFGATLRESAGRGVEVYAYRCKVSPHEIVLAHEVPVLL